MRVPWTSIAALAAVVGLPGLASARTLHVTKAGRDDDPGTLAQPYLTIGKAAREAQPGDTVSVHGGIYREAVMPVQGGTSESTRIVYRAAPGEKPIVKGSERIAGWTRQEGDVWKADLPASFFGSANPYVLTLDGGWMLYGQWHHRGDVFLEDKGLIEVETADAIRSRPMTWFTRTANGLTTIQANFGGADPNQALTEINVRSACFSPAENFRNYITVKGFTFMHAANNWGPPLQPQPGAVWTRGGHHWIIEDNTVIHARAGGISVGIPPGGSWNTNDYTQVGHHVIRNNVALKCGQAGIFGMNGANASLIAGNTIDSTNYRDEFGGWEVAGIKIHWSIDAVISGNTVKRTRGRYGNFGIWIDFGNQNTRVTGNLLVDNQGAAIFLEANHGPQIVDNNIIIGSDIRLHGNSAAIIAHNLLVNGEVIAILDPDPPEGPRSAGYFQPHTRNRTGNLPVNPIRDVKVYNNIFIGKGASGIVEGVGNISDFNLFLGGGRKSRWDANSLVGSVTPDFKYREDTGGAMLSFTLPAEALQLPCPMLSRDFFGVFAKVSQGIENPDGSPLVINRDFLGTPRAAQRPKVGPFENLRSGANEFRWDRNAATGVRAPGRKTSRRVFGKSVGGWGSVFSMDMLGRRVRGYKMNGVPK